MRNSKRSKALDYAKGIAKPNNQFRSNVIQIDNFDDEMLDDDDYTPNNYSHQYNNAYKGHDYSDYNNRISEEDMEESLPMNSNKFASEIDKIKAMFN